MWNAADTSQLPLGTVTVDNAGYSGGTLTYSGSSMVQNGATITITLGTGTSSAAVTGAVSMAWAPDATAYDPAGNSCGATTRSESGPATQSSKRPGVA